MAILLVLSVSMRVLGVEPWLNDQGLNLAALLIFAAVLGFGGSFMSPAVSRWMAPPVRFMRCGTPSPYSGKDSADPAVQIHLLNVQRPLSQYIARFVGAAERRAFHREQSALALRPACALLDGCGAPYRVHTEIGDKARVTTQLAGRLRCDRIVMSTARKSSLLRWVENSTTNRVLELTPVPVVVIAGDAPSKLERYGVPAGVGTALGSLMFAAAE